MIDEPDLVLAIQTRLKAEPAVTAITDMRIYRKGEVPATPGIPYIVVAEISDIADDDTNTSGYAHARIQCTCFATSDRVASKLSKTVRNALHRITSTVLPAGTGNVYAVSIFDAGDGSDGNSETPLFMYYRDFAIEYS